MLGVVCAPESQESLSDTDRRLNEKFFSQWGAEVLFKTTPLGDGPFAHHFEKATVLFDGVQAVTVEEATKRVGVRRPAIVAGHAVQYDQKRKCWFADLHVPLMQRSFLPWIRLGLVRFQPDSISGCHVSPVVLSAFCQALPDRVVTVVRSATDSRRLLMSVAGIGPIDEKGAQMLSVLEVGIMEPLESTSATAEEAYLDENGHLWIEHASATLPWEAKDDGNGAYSGEIWLGRANENKTRLLIRESLKSFSPGSNENGRPILLETPVI